MIQQRRHAPPPAPAALKTREVEVPVVGGLHTGVPSQSAPRSFSPALQNFVPDVDGFITPRSGLSSYASVMGGVALGAFEASDATGIVFGIATSATSVNVYSGYDDTWSRLSYVAGNQAWHAGTPSGDSQAYFRGVEAFDLALKQNIFVFSNSKTNSLKWFVVDNGTTTFSDFTWADSIDSTGKAKDVVAINDRLFLFNTESSSGAVYPKRAMWSARGNPRSFLIADGAGAEDLMDMQGIGQASVRWREILLLFTEKEIWRAIPTEDDYAFRFELAVDNMGTSFPKTIVSTPFGVAFMGPDLEVYLTDGATVAPLGPVGGAGASRIQNKLRDEAIFLHRAWALYNSTFNRLELYYTIAGSPDGFPSRAIYYDFATATWWPQAFAHGLSCGVDKEDNGARIGAPFVQTLASTRSVDVFGSTGSAYIVTSARTNDAGSAIDVRWRSPGLRAGMRKAHMKELWIDADVTSASSMSVWLGSARSGSVFTAEREVSLTTANDPTFVPTWTTDNAPAFEVRIADGSRPRIASFSATLQDASKF